MFNVNDEEAIIQYVYDSFFELLQKYNIHNVSTDFYDDKFLIDEDSYENTTIVWNTIWVGLDTAYDVLKIKNLFKDLKKLNIVICDFYVTTDLSSANSSSMMLDSNYLNKLYIEKCLKTLERTYPVIKNFCINIVDIGNYIEIQIPQSKMNWLVYLPIIEYAFYHTVEIQDGEYPGLDIHILSI